ncbi:hypothetical protein MUN82_06430 [Hymenobacter aerilatus]|uniref:Uncharacterized protein n=1 Tax=Hymenobacter aerilatus TaxID=2932251 RepID=A0A8T9SZA3_9BACT|nr:hypothetical protein [Hymenobacter aerilatus]UOR06731.1 hypothetical protein MUN82_06430 [Hymenobacter aerilatus]
MLTEYTSQPISVDVIDYVRGATRYHQVVVNRSISIVNNADGSVTVTMPLEIHAYAVNEDGSRGERMPHADRRDTLVSEADRAVDPATGAMRYRRLTSTTSYNYATGEEEEIPVPEGQILGDWLAYLEAKPEPLMLQGKFLAAVHDTQDVNLRHLREQYIRDADAAPSRFQ